MAVQGAIAEEAVQGAMAEWAAQGAMAEPPPWSWPRPRPYSRRPGWHRHWAGLRTPLRSALENRSAPWACIWEQKPTLGYTHEQDHFWS